jgi:L-asparaginase / beta-aspartyl-peptidase
MKPATIVHGGCGTPPTGEEARRNEICENAAETSYRLLLDGGSALDACEAAIRVMEDSKLLNAGSGAYLQADGRARVDASIMADDGRAGAVVQVPLLANPIRLAMYLLKQEAHIMLSGAEALQLAVRLGHESCVIGTPAKIEFWQSHLNDACMMLDYEAMAKEWKASNPRLGTVGCVCLDSEGHLAAGTSTGGTGQVYPGRVGDTPIIGAGTYCTRQVGVSMTGVGERVLVLLSAKSFCDHVKNGKMADEGAELVLNDLGRVSKASAGLIALDSMGNAVAKKNTTFMACAKRP